MLKSCVRQLVCFSHYWSLYVDVLHYMLQHCVSVCVYSYFESTVLVSVYLHVPVTVAVQRSEHDAEGSGPVTEQHEQTVSQRLLGENTPPLVHCGTHTHTNYISKKERI